MTVITIDGPAGSGKSTVSRMLAGRLKYLYLDTGAMYRAVALMAMRNRVPFKDETQIKRLCSSIEIRFEMSKNPPALFCNGMDISKDIRTPEMDMLSSKISAIGVVRREMRRLQREIAEGTDIVAEGRDMGTEVFPFAEHKFFLTASIDLRAERRYRERIKRGEEVTLEQVKADMELRDMQDENRAVAPLRPARDAIIIDSSRLTPEEVVGEMLRQMGLPL